MTRNYFQSLYKYIFIYLKMHFSSRSISTQLNYSSHSNALFFGFSYPYPTVILKNNLATILHCKHTIQLHYS